MSALADWLISGVLHGTVFFLVAWALSATVLKHAHPAARAVLFGLVVLRFAFPFGPTLHVPAPVVTSTARELLSSAPATLVVNSVKATRPRLEDVLVGLWAFAVLALAARRFLKHRALVAELAGREVDVARVRELATQLGVRSPSVAVHERGPCVVGLVRPVLVLPSTAQGPELDAMIVHELTHLRRGDLLWRAAQLVVETLFFFWPVVRVAGRHLSLAREQACDLAVVEAGVLPRARYAEILLQLGLEASPRLAMASQPGHLERRITMVLNEKKLRPKWVLVAVLTVAGLAGASASVSMFDPQADYLSSPARAKSSVTPLSLKGSLDERALATQMIMMQRDFDECYLALVRAGGGVPGSVVLHLTIDTAGNVTDTCQSPGTTLPMEVGRCVSQRLSFAQFPMPFDLQPVEVEYRFDFEPPPLG